MNPQFRAEDFGAVGDGLTLNTAAIQHAIDAAALAGGVLAFSPGVYLTGSLFLKSGITLQLDLGVTLRGSQDLTDYPLLPTRIAGIEMVWPAALLNVCEQADVRIQGAGQIDGDGKIFWDSYWTLRRAYEPRGLRWASDYDAQRPRLLQVFKSTRVSIGDGLLLRRSGFWTLHICYSSEVTVSRITIRNNEDGRGPSTDGIDIDSSSRVLIAHADIAVNDDAICIKAGRDADGLRVARPTEDVLIRDCIVRAGAAGLTFGSETSGGFRNIDASRITVLSAVPVGILFKSAPTRGGFGHDLRLQDFRLVDVAVALRITMNWNPAYSLASLPAELVDLPPHWRVLTSKVPPAQGMARLRDVHISRLQASGVQTAFEVDAYPDAPLQGFRFSELDISAQQGGHIRDAQDWKFEHCRLDLGERVSLAAADEVQGLPEGSWQVVSSLAARDVSALSFEEQDKQ
ncbi:glycoside hydrolase family 28 protein [Paucibacter oligotrophus]|uniref:Glycoside hydrolase family 28 protein n=2 Tax=Roseateles oligotrophus TaxID=1769250 RepID=A0ABT2YAA5_9BURK|nr:glycoside hydrolase family 28 protein [Roseateles oligotrophus]